MKTFYLSTAKLKSLLILAFLTASSASFAAWDIWQAYVITNVNGGGNTYQQAGLDGTDPTVSFVNRYYGRFSSGQSLVMAGGELKSYKNGSSNVCGATLFYRVYRTCDTPGSFNSIALGFSCNYPCTGLNSAGDQKWSTSSGSTNLLSGLTTSGTYVIEAYWMLEGNTSSSSGCGEFKYASLSGVNYRAYFEYEVTDSFSDGDFTSSLAWSGDASNWTIATKSDAGGLTGAEATQSSTLRLNSTAAVGTEYLSTSYTAWNSQQEWYFFVGRRNQSATAANQSIVWLYANEATLESGTVDGYRIVIGDDTGNDEIILQRVDNGVGTAIFTTSSSITNNIVDWGVTFKITRRSNGRWVISTSTLPTSTGAGATALSCPDALSTVTHTDATSGLAYVVENTYVPSVSGTGYFGVVATHGSATAETSAMEFDNLRIVPLPPDTYVQISGATSSTIAEDASGLVDISVDIFNQSATVATTVQLVLTSGSSGRFGGGLTTPATYGPSYTTQTLTWAAGTSGTKHFYIDPDNNGVCDDNATILLQLQSASGGLNAYVGSIDTYTLTITDDNIGYLTLISDTFEDGNLNSPSPAWTPIATGSWTASTTTPISGSYSMRSVSTGSPGSNYISYDTDKASLYGQTNTWRFNLQYNLEPNPANKWLVFLAANESNLASSTVDGYAVGINPATSGDPDILTLWKVVDGTPNSAICTSSLDWGIAQNIVGFEIVRSTTGLWTFKIDSNGGFDALVTQGTPSTDNTYSDMGYFGVRNAFTSSNGAKLALDDITFTQQGCREVYYSRQTGNWNDAIWSTSSNTGSAPWSSITPSRYTELVIQSGHTVTLNTSSVCNNLTLDNGGTLAGSSNTLTVFGNWTNNGTFTAQTSTVWLKGAAAQSIAGATATTFNNLIVDSDGGTVNVSTANTTVKGLVSPEEGTLQCAGNLVLASDATSSGSIGEIKSGADVSGNLTLQRYIPAATAGWVMLGCPILNSLTLADWDDDLIITGITGGTDGFNPPSYTFVNVQYYDETQAGGRNIGWVSATNMTNQLTPSGVYNIHRGYNVYMQPSAQTVDVTGPIQKGSVTINLSYTVSTPANAGDGWNYITPPYPSEVDWVAVEANSSDIGTYYIYDAQLPGYRSYNANSLVGNATSTIPHSETILVKATTFGQTLNFLESHKTNTNTAFERDETSSSMMVFRIEKDNLAGEATLAFVDGSTNNYESSFDAEYLESPVAIAPQVAMVSADDSLLAISAIPQNLQTISIPVYIKMPEAGSYLFSITQMQNMSFGSCITIEDLATGEITAMESGQTITLNTDVPYTGNRLLIHITAPIGVASTDATCFGSLTGTIEVTTNEGDWTYTGVNDMGAQVFDGNGNILWPYVGAGHYLFTFDNGTDGCTPFTKDVLISEPAQSSSWAEGGMDLCNASGNGTIDIGMIGDNNFGYSISNSLEELVASGESVNGSFSLSELTGDVYSVSVSYACGSDVYTLDLTDPNAVSAEILSSATEIAIPFGDSVLVTFNGTTNATDFHWTFAGNEMGNTNPLEVYVSNTGTYDVAFTAMNEGCSQTVHQTLTASVFDNTQELSQASAVTLIKTGQTLQLTFANTFATPSTVRIYNALGQLVHDSRSNEMVQQVDLSGLSNGSYTIQVLNNGTTLLKQTIVK